MKQFLLLAMALLISVATVNGQSKKKKHVEDEEPAVVEEAYQVVNVTKEASVCYDTLTKAYDLVCFVNQGNTQKTINVKLGVTWDEVAASLHKVMTDHNVKFPTIAKVLRYLIMERRMPVGNYSMTVDYCTPYSLKLNVYLADYDFDKVPMTFALAEPKGETFKDRTNFSGQLSTADKELIKTLIKEEFIKNDVEAQYYLIVLDGPAPEVVAAPEEPAKEKKAKADKPNKEDKPKADKPNKEDKKEKKH